MLSKEGKARNSGIGAVIAEKSFPKIFIGREVQPDKIETLFGRELEDTEINDFKEDPYIKEYFLCTVCEKKLGVLESLVSITYSKLFEFEVIVNSPNKFRKLSKFDYNAFQLLILSILWRASVTKFGTFRVNQSFEKKIRVLLLDTLSENTKLLQKKIKINSQKIERFPMIILHQAMSDLSNTINENSVLFHPFSESPYYALINEFIICVYHKKKSLFNSPTKYIGIEGFFSKKEITFVNRCSLIKVISEDESENIRKKLMKKIAKKRIDEYQSLFIELHVSYFSFKPHYLLTKKFIDDFINFNKDLTPFDKYSFKQFKTFSISFFNRLKENI
jgi:hypothetical protein